MRMTRRAVIGSGLVAAITPRVALAQDDTAALMEHVAPELREAARAFMQMGTAPSAFSRDILPSMRQGALRYSRPALPTPAWEEAHTQSADGSEIRLFVINKSPGASKPAILYTHGGGFIMGSADSDLANLQSIAQALDCVVLSVDYRLAPETSWRGSTEDNYAGLKWLAANVEALGVDINRIAVMGESAGGGHAALLALLARDRGEVPLCFQCLVYPMLDDRTGTRVIPPWPMGRIVWTDAQNRFGWESILGQPPGTATVPAAAVPARRGDLAGLPPAWIGVGTLDLFVDEDLEYARRLIAAQVPVQVEVVPGAFHGFDFAGDAVPLVNHFNQSKLSALARAFGIVLPA